MDYYITWKGQRKFVGRVEYYGETAVPVLMTAGMIEDEIPVRLTMLALVYIESLNRYMVLYEGTRNGKDTIYFVHDSHVIGRFNDVELTWVKGTRQQVFDRFIGNIRYKYTGEKHKPVTGR